MHKLTRPILLGLFLALVFTSNLLALSGKQERGTIRGSVYLDVDGDGRWVVVR